MQFSECFVDVLRVALWDLCQEKHLLLDFILFHVVFSYRLLHDKLPGNLKQQTFIISHVLWMGNLGAAGLSGSGPLSLRRLRQDVSWGCAIWRLDRLDGPLLRRHTRWLLAGGVSFSPRGPLHRAVQACEEEAMLEVTTLLLFIRNKSLSPAHTRGVGREVPLARKWVKRFVDFLKSPQMIS